jgi:hypothetical protein
MTIFFTPDQFTLGADVEKPLRGSLENLFALARSLAKNYSSLKFSLSRGGWGENLDESPVFIGARSIRLFIGDEEVGEIYVDRRSRSWRSAEYWYGFEGRYAKDGVPVKYNGKLYNTYRVTLKDHKKLEDRIITGNYIRVQNPEEQYWEFYRDIDRRFKSEIYLPLEMIDKLKSMVQSQWISSVLHEPYAPEVEMMLARMPGAFATIDESRDRANRELEAKAEELGVEVRTISLPHAVIIVDRLRNVKASGMKIEEDDKGGVSGDITL